MSSTARTAILEALYQGQKSVDAFPPKAEVWSAPMLSEQEKKQQFVEKLQKAFATVVTIKENEILATLTQILHDEGIQKIVHGRNVWITPIVEQLSVQKLPYTAPIEELETELFSTVDASITTTRGGIAENGTLILYPSPDEPRTISLVPPIHIALVREKDLFSSLSEVIEKEQWKESRPTNMLLIASPSRTADIELVLAVGVHGPKKLIVLLIEEN